jgi:deazaflavin-dependent oxidoreductase (nitroreductase family)
MPSDEFYTRFTTSIPDWALRWLGKWNVPIYRATRGSVMGNVGKAPVLLITTTGRKSGQTRTAPVLYMQDGDRFVVIGSNAGNQKAPAWALNLEANPEAHVNAKGKLGRVRARVAEGEEREELWRRANEQYAGFDDYKTRTARDIRLFVLEPAS